MITDYGVEIGDGPSRFKVIESEFGESLSRGIRSCYEDLRESPVKTGARSVPRKTTPRIHFIVILSEGRNRQIRRTFASLGYTVTKLHRTQFGEYSLGDLKPNKYAIIKV